MKKFAYIFLLIFNLSFLISNSLHAQHCAWDGYGIIVVQVISENGDTIDGLNLTMIETNYKNFTSSLWKNPPKTTNKGLGDNVSPLETQKIRFPFAGNNYIFVHGRNMSGKLIIEDTDGNKNGGEFETTTLELSAENTFNLCTSNNDWDLDENFIYTKTIHITLKRKNK